MQTIQYVYEIFRTNEAAGGTDVLNVGLPMFQADVAAGERKHCPVALDFAALKRDYEAMTSEERKADNLEFLSAERQTLGRIRSMGPGVSRPGRHAGHRQRLKYMRGRGHCPAPSALGGIP